MGKIIVLPRWLYAIPNSRSILSQVRFKKKILSNLIALFFSEILRFIALHICLKILVSENCCVDRYPKRNIEPRPKKKIVLEMVLTIFEIAK